MSTQSGNYPDWRAETIKHNKRRSLINQAAAMVGLNNLQRHSDLQIETTRAENHAAMRAAGWDPVASCPDSDAEGGEMGNMQLGDNHNYPAPVIVTGGANGSPGMSTIAAILLGTAIPAAGALGGLGTYLLTRETPPPADTKPADPADPLQCGLRLAKPADSGSDTDQP
jgi:hypothetical protein